MTELSETDVMKVCIGKLEEAQKTLTFELRDLQLRVEALEAKKQGGI